MNLHMSFAPKLMNEEAAAFYLGVSIRKLAQLQAQGRLIPKALDNKRGFLRDDLDAFAESLPDWGTHKNAAA